MSNCRQQSSDNWHTHAISRADEVKAAKEPILRWTPKHDQTGASGAVTGGAEVVKREW